MGKAHDIQTEAFLQPQQNLLASLTIVIPLNNMAMVR